MRYELSDYEWAAIKPMLPNKPRGVRQSAETKSQRPDLLQPVSVVPRMAAVHLAEPSGLG